MTEEVTDPASPASPPTPRRVFLWLSDDTTEYLTVTHQPLPDDGPGFPTGTEARVCGDIARRQQLGIAKYGTTVADNPLHLVQWMRHHYEELLDAAVYVRRSIEKLEAMLAQQASDTTTTTQESKT